MTTNQRLRFAAIASLAIAGASFTYAQNDPGGAEKPNNTARDRNTAGAGAGGQDRAVDRSGGQTDSREVSAALGKIVDAAFSGDQKKIALCFWREDAQRFGVGGTDTGKTDTGKTGSGTSGSGTTGSGTTGSGTGGTTGTGSGTSGTGGTTGTGTGTDTARQGTGTGAGAGAAANAGGQDFAQVAQQVKQAYQQKYNKQLSFANAPDIFGTDFFRSGGGLDTAQPAGGRIQGSGTGTSGTGGTGTGTGSGTGSGAGTGTSGTGTGSGTSGTGTGTSGTGTGTSGTGTGTSGTGAGTTGSGLSNLAGAQIITIPASHGMGPVVVPLMREGSDWKINVPDTLNQQKLQQNLVQHLNMVLQQKDQWPADEKEAQKSLAHHVLAAVMDQDNKAGEKENIRDGAGRTGTGTGTGTGGTNSPGNGGGVNR